MQGVRRTTPHSSEARLRRLPKAGLYVKGEIVIDKLRDKFGSGVVWSAFLLGVGVLGMVVGWAASLPVLAALGIGFALFGGAALIASLSQRA